MSNNKVINLSTKDTLRVDLSIEISNDYDIDKVREAILSVMESYVKIKEDPAPEVKVKNLTMTTFILEMQPHCRVEDYMDV